MHRLLISGAVIFCLISVAGADASLLSLKDAISMALENNNRIKAASFNYQSASQGVVSANSGYLPTVTFEEALTASNSPMNTFMMKLDEGRFSPADFASAETVNKPSPSHDFKTALSIQQPLFVPSLAPLKEMAVKDARKSELELDAARQSIAFEAFYTYLGVMNADAQLKAIEKALAEARENLRLAGVRTAAGVGLRSDEFRSRTHLSSVEQQHISSSNDLMLVRMKLAMLIGLPDDSQYQVSDSIDFVTVPLLNDNIIKNALDNRVDMKRSQTDLEKAATAENLAQGEYLPTVGAFATYQLNAKNAPFTSENDAWNAGVSLKWNLFDGFRRGSEHERAVSGRSAARENLESVTKEVRYQLRESYARRDEAGKRLEVARNMAQDAEESARLLVKRYENSLATLVELLDAQTTLNRARAGLADAEIGYALAGGRVYYMTGTFIKEMLK